MATFINNNGISNFGESNEFDRYYNIENSYYNSPFVNNSDSEIDIHSTEKCFICRENYDSERIKHIGGISYCNECYHNRIWRCAMQMHKYIYCKMCNECLHPDEREYCQSCKIRIEKSKVLKPVMEENRYCNNCGNQILHDNTRIPYCNGCRFKILWSGCKSDDLNNSDRNGVDITPKFKLWETQSNKDDWEPYYLHKRKEGKYMICSRCKKEKEVGNGKNEGTECDTCITFKAMRKKGMRALRTLGTLNTIVECI